MPANLTDFLAANGFIVAIALLLIAAIVFTESKRLFKKYKDIEPTEAVRLLNRSDTVMLDVREGGELGAGLIRGARQFAASSAASRLGELEEHKSKTVIAFCANGLRGNKVCQLLSKNGFTDVYHMKGGIAAWGQANLPLVKK